MLNLKKVTIDDIDILKEYPKYERSNNADYTLGQLIAWSDYLKLKYDIIERTLILNVNLESIGEAWYVPIGKNVENALNIIFKV